MRRRNPFIQNESMDKVQRDKRLYLTAGILLIIAVLIFIATILDRI
jgi:hypothetical protein